MSVEEIRAGLAEAQRLPNGRAKAERLELLAVAAKGESDRVLEASLLLTLVSAYEYGGEREQLPITFARLLKIYDEFPTELGRFTHDIHWKLKWMSGSLLLNPAVPLPAVRKWLDEFESRYRQRGYSPRPVRSLRAWVAQLEGDDDAASAAMDASIAAPRDRMADCEACERNDWGDLRVDLGDDEGACREWEPVLAGRLRCMEEPARVLAMALMPLARLGRLDEARSAHLRGYPLARGNVSLRKSIGYHLEFCAQSGNEARGLEILIEHKAWLTRGNEDVHQRLQFITGALVLLRRLAALGLGDTPVGAGTVESAGSELAREADEICARYDARNGSTVMSSTLAQRLNQEPLTDWLPLGFSVQLPQTRKPAPAPSVAASLEDELAEAARLTRLRHPDARRAWLRVAKRAEESGEALPDAARAEIDRRRAEKLFETDPAEAQRAFLDVAEQFAALPDPGGALRARGQAVAALARTGDRQGAEDAAKVIAEQARAAFEAAEISAHDYLVARRSPVNLAYDALAQREERPADEVKELAALVEAEIAEAGGLEDTAVAASLYELLAQLAHWASDPEAAADHLSSATELYVRAEQPWFAAAPTATLAQFALGRDAAQAEAHARRATELGGNALEPQLAAHLGTLLVEAISRQRGRESDIVDAALRASARWQGISEPDELHLRFTAARAYHATGRHAEAVTLFAELMPRVEVPYGRQGVAMSHKTYGEALSRLGNRKAAAEQFLLAARGLEDDPDNVLAYAQVSWSAAESLAACADAGTAIAAYEKAVELWRGLGALGPAVRCRRSVAWLLFNDDEAERAIELMREVRDELQAVVGEAGDSGAPEAAAELAETEKQLAQMAEAEG
ncbi:hypothetical protein KDL01_25650 [Actinospica durhamensis]|uniref:Tetratricopeptide repeat protein n=1 Tax=Actinospica durhamensis TaxID=1508375 RepID=A0A941ETD6_9ACTN|nr:hypothetical protein [Actinospica durhamensis]MBR7836691.1 hypothetical protein [Actinospica durhamensis]